MQVLEIFEVLVMGIVGRQFNSFGAVVKTFVVDPRKDTLTSQGLYGIFTKAGDVENLIVKPTAQPSCFLVAVPSWCRCESDQSRLCAFQAEVEAESSKNGAITGRKCAMCFIYHHGTAFLAENLKVFRCQIAALTLCRCMKLLDACHHRTAFPGDSVLDAPQATDGESLSERHVTMAQVEPHFSKCLYRLLAQFIALRNPENDRTICPRLSPRQESLNGRSGLSGARGKRQDRPVLVARAVEYRKKLFEEFLLEVGQGREFHARFDIERIGKCRFAFPSCECERHPNCHHEVRCPRFTWMPLALGDRVDFRAITASASGRRRIFVQLRQGAGIAFARDDPAEFTVGEKICTGEFDEQVNHTVVREAKRLGGSRLPFGGRNDPLDRSASTVAGETCERCSGFLRRQSSTEKTRHQALVPRTHIAWERCFIQR